MSVVIMDGKVRVYWLSALPSNIALPTVAELNAGTNFTTYINPDGLDISWTTGKVDVGNVGSTFTLNKVGRRVPDITLTCHHDQTTGSTDPAWATLVYQATGVLVVRRGVDTATAWATGQGAGGTTGQVEVFPVQVSQEMPSKPAPDTSWDFSVPLTVYLDPNTRAVVA
jgi:hypothetical protein